MLAVMLDPQSGSGLELCRRLGWLDSQWGLCPVECWILKLKSRVFVLLDFAVHSLLGLLQNMESVQYLNLKPEKARSVPSCEKVKPLHIVIILEQPIGEMQKDKALISLCRKKKRKKEGIER